MYNKEQEYQIIVIKETSNSITGTKSVVYKGFNQKEHIFHDKEDTGSYFVTENELNKPIQIKYRRTGINFYITGKIIK